MDRPNDLPPGFDPDIYLDLNPDIRAQGVDAARHWLQLGRYENRPYQRPHGEGRDIRIPEQWKGDDPFGRGMDVLNFCLGHTQPYFPLHNDMIVCEMAPKGAITSPGRVINCQDTLPFYQEYKPYLGMVYGLFAANHYLRNNISDLDIAVNFSTYRLFTLPFSTPVVDAPLKMSLIHPTEVEAIAHLIAPTTAMSPWLLPHPFFVDTVEAQYAASHQLDDFTVFLDGAVSEGVLTTDQAYQCRMGIFYLPSAAMGRMPARVFCDVTERMEVVTRRFLKGASFDNRDNYQIRFVQFCYERVANYLVECEIRKSVGALDRQHFGYWTLITENGRYQPGVVKPAVDV